MLCLDAAMYLWVPQGKTLAFRIGLGCMLGMPLIMAGSQGAALGRMRPVRSKQRGPITFLAIRPILTGDMLDAKYRMITRNVIQIWLVTLAITGTVVLVKGQAGDVAEILRSFLQLYPGWRGWAILGLAIGLAPVLTWKLLTDSLVGGAHGPALACRRGRPAERLPPHDPDRCRRLVRNAPRPHRTPRADLDLDGGDPRDREVYPGVVAFRIALDRGLLQVRSILRILASGR